ncbi:hypothetical protein F4778DRAFT_789959 [Xylariomycetidae sp. FL2044]|nr:hypothetical protein F4778DRAFT_789959 [Xylariomycetidae sp. FL2044]
MMMLFDSEKYPLTKKSRRHLLSNAGVGGAMILVVLLRVYCRFTGRAGLGWDDGLILISAMLGVGLVVEAGFLSGLGMGHHMVEVERNYSIMMTVFRSLRYTFFFCTGLNKLSALAFYLRIFPSRQMKFACIIMSTIVILWTSGNVTQEIISCDAVNRIVEPANTQTCVERKDADIATAAGNAFGDLVVLVLPLQSIWKLQMRISDKIQLTILLLLGLAVTGVALARLDAIVDTDYEGDITTSGLNSLTFSVLEPNLAIICMSLPMIQPLLRGLCRRRDHESVPQSFEHGDHARPAPSIPSSSSTENHGGNSGAGEEAKTAVDNLQKGKWPSYSVQVVATNTRRTEEVSNMRVSPATTTSTFTACPAKGDLPRGPASSDVRYPSGEGVVYHFVDSALKR